MAAQAQDNEEDSISGINVTPLVDIMLVLLIIFMVTASLVANKAIELKLPESESAQALKPDEKTLNFALDRSGKFYVDGEPIEFDAIAPRIRAEREKKPGVNLAAAISADAQTPYEQVVKLIDVIRKNDIIDFAIQTEPTSSAPAPAP
jgi:biopolymer transport protein TolR